MSTRRTIINIKISYGISRSTKVITKYIGVSDDGGTNYTQFFVYNSSHDLHQTWNFSTTGTGWKLVNATFTDLTQISDCTHVELGLIQNSGGILELISLAAMHLMILVHFKI